MDVDWAIKVLTRLRGTDIPLDKEQLSERLKGGIIKDKPFVEIVNEIKFPVNTPAEVLKELKR